MTETMILPESDVENAALTPEATDESLIHDAKELNASYNGHLKRSIEDFWRLGETLSHLFQRRHTKGRWADILAEIGISTTTDSHARHLYRDSTIEGLAEFKNKTAALRALGILSTPASKPPQGRPPGFEGQKLSPDHSTKLPSTAPTAKADSAADEEAVSNVEAGHDSDLQRAGHRPTTTPAQGDSLGVLVMVAARLEMLADQGIEPSPDHLIQIDRAIEALDRLRAGELASVSS